MSVYKRGKCWWYRFNFQGVVIRESTGLTSIEAAREVEDDRHTALRKSRRGIAKRARVPMFSTAADAYLKAKRRDWAPTAILNISSQSLGTDFSAT